jgi:branched-chain amino acid transport system substrate-binding protein
MMAVHQKIVESRKPLIGTNAGPAPMAGAMCSPYFFSTSFQNDQAPAAAGRAMQQAGLKRVYVLTPNYRAGKDAVVGFKSEFRGEIVGETYTSMDQTDYSVELAKIRTAAPDGIFVFYPGGYGIQFLKQYRQAGLQLPLYTYGAMDQATLPALGDAAMGVKGVAIWSIDLPNAANKAFVERFRAAYGYLPADFAAQAYDAIMLIDSAVRKVGGKVDDKAKLIAAIKQADFQSVRGNFRFNSNHFPIQNFLLREGTRDTDGNYVTATRAVAIGDATDPYVAQCKMN